VHRAGISVALTASMNKEPKRLSLDVETVKRLDDDKIGGVNGGAAKLPPPTNPRECWTQREACLSEACTAPGS
jgi:hypothetical protein